MRFVRAPWRWIDGAWRQPGAVGMIDLRTLEQCAARDGSNPGFGLFVFDDDRYVADAESLDDRSERSITTDVWGRVSRDLLPDSIGRLRVKLGPVDMRYTVRHGEALFDSVSRRMKADIEAVDDLYLRGKFLSASLMKLRDSRGRHVRIDRESAKALLGIDENPLTPETTITDDFDRVTQSGLGTSGEGWSWTVVEGAFNVAGNAAVVMANNSSARAETDLSSDDHYAQVEIVSTSGSADGGVACRYSDSAATYYKAIWNGSSGPYETHKVVAGTPTAIGTDQSGIPSINDSIRIKSDGTTITRYVAGVENDVVTDATISGNLRVGLAGHKATRLMNNFIAADLLVTISLASHRPSCPTTFSPSKPVTAR